jgi:hypothetical protein
MNDERAVLGLPFIALWRCPKSDSLDWRIGRTWLVLTKSTLPLVAGLAAALLIRNALTLGWIGPGIPKPPLYGQIEHTAHMLKPWLGSWGVWLINCLKGPGWLGLFLITPFLSLLWRPGFFPALILGASFVLVCIATFIVADVARSIGFAFPSALLGCIWMYDREPHKARILTLFAVTLQLISPTLWIYQNWQWLQFRPLPWEFWLWIHH